MVAAAAVDHEVRGERLQPALERLHLFSGIGFIIHHLSLANCYLGFGVKGLEFGAWGLGFRLERFGFGVWGLGFRV